MKTNTIIKALEKALASSVHPDQWNDDIQPSARRLHDGDKLGAKIELLIEILKGEEE